MRVFQLDVSDCDCILNEMRSLQLPVYVVHAQVLETWLPPTMGFRPAGLWWTDVYRMAEHFKEIRGRRDESRSAAYFNKVAFSPMASFPASLYQDGRFVLGERYSASGIPAMYR